MKIAFVPIDNRPVCYQLPLMISKLNPEIELAIPPSEFLGSLHTNANVDRIFEWFNTIGKVDAIIISLDTLAYGGLIPSRRCENSFENIKERIYKLKRILEPKESKIYAFSSIMRISNNNINEEEKEYWNIYGKKIFQYSYNLDRTGEEETDIPKSIINDYLDTRRRNFNINKIYLKWQKEGFFDTLIFSKDDCAEFGLNVMEARELEALGGYIKTGADEIPLTLLSRAVNKKIKVAPIFLAPEFKHLVSNYEDVSIEKSVYGQLELGGCEIVSEDEADVILVVNNFENHQGEIVMKQFTKPFNGNWSAPKKPYMIADVRFANGADNAFVKHLFKEGLNENFLGYSGWNTSANSIGSLICTMKFALNAPKNKNFKLLQAIRLLDDWGYQANVRQMITVADAQEVKEKMLPFENKVKALLGINFEARYSFPWNRLFEVKIELN